MKNFRLKSVLFVLFAVTAFASCNNDDDESPVKEITKNALATEVKGPATGKVNVELSYDVTFVPETVCGEFNKFTEVTIGTIKGLQVEVKYPAQVCTQQVPAPKTVVYKFKSAVKGTFEIKFKKSETEFITQTVVISE